ncbi:MAG: S-adenosylmethionine:tRNA ribosyltransferase-isomerase [Thermoplasmata archaeon]|nr:S-adenosylmethionine:tRNA ribosyltransferase-isomerase [Thermoplasmata archaeon]
MSAAAPPALPPRALEADRPPEARGTERDEVRLMVSRPDRIEHLRFRDLAGLLGPRDLVVVNESLTLPASVPAEGAFGPFRVSVSTRYGRGVWLAEPRWSAHRPGPVPLGEGEGFRIAGLPARVVASYPGIPRLAFVHVEGDLERRMAEVGVPIQYYYAHREFPLEAYQTVFGRYPGSAEMPSAGRPFTPRLVQALSAHGVRFSSVILHAGVSSLSTDDCAAGSLPIFPEPFHVPRETAEAVEHTRNLGGRVIAVGTTVVRALAAASPGGVVRAASGFTQAFVHPGRAAPSVDALLTGLHDPGTTHLSMLEAFMGGAQLRDSYAAAIDAGYLWHEFGDSHLILRG